MYCVLTSDDEGWLNMQQDDAEKDAIKWNKKKEGHKKTKNKKQKIEAIFAIYF